MSGTGAPEYAPYGDDIEHLTAEIDRLIHIIATQAATLRLLRADAESKDPPPPSPDPPSTAKGQVPGPPNHNPFREFPADRRRIGGD